MIARLFASQSRKPAGLLGRFIGHSMARGNEFEVNWTVSLLNIQPHDHVLEVGFGPGVAIQLVSQQATKGLTAGVDFSPLMVKSACKRNATAIQAGLVELKQGDVAARFGVPRPASGREPAAGEIPGRLRPRNKMRATDRIKKEKGR